MVVDASVWVAALLANDARQTGNAAIAGRAVAFLREQTWIQLSPLNDALSSLAASIAAQQQLRGADAIYVALAAQGDAALVTLDREMLERAPDSVIATTPSAWLKQTH